MRNVQTSYYGETDVYLGSFQKIKKINAPRTFLLGAFVSNFLGVFEKRPRNLNRTFVEKKKKITPRTRIGHFKKKKLNVQTSYFHFTSYSHLFKKLLFFFNSGFEEKCPIQTFSPGIGPKKVCLKKKLIF